MTDFALRERRALADTLAAAEPTAPTLCSPWTTAELAAHLVLREATPVELLAQTRLAPLKRLADATVSAYARRVAYADLVQHVRVGPPWYSPTALPPVRELVNLLEYVIHHEDVRRATLGWKPRELPDQTQQAVWSRVAGAGRTLMRSAPVGVRFEWPAHRSAAVRSGPDVVTVRGNPVELALVASGRQRVADVSYDGSRAAVAMLAEARFGL